MLSLASKLPNSQYGSVAVLPSVSSASYPSNSDLVVSDDRSSVGRVESASGSNIVSVSDMSTSLRSASVNSDLSALSIRATEYLHRWKDVVHFSSKDYSGQMAAPFGIKAPEYMGNHAHYLGGWSSVKIGRASCRERV